MYKIKWPWPGKEASNNLEQKSGVLGTTDALGKFMIFGVSGGETPGSALSLYEDSTAISIPINKVAEAFASIEPVLKIDGKIIKDHEILDFLRQPSPFFDGVLFQETLAKNYLVTSESYTVALGNVNRPPLEMQPISPRNVSPVEGSGGYAHKMDISGNTLTGVYDAELKPKRLRYFNGNLKELSYMRGYSTKNNSLLRGQSLLVPASAEARQHILGNKHNVSMLEKGGRLSAVFHFDQDLNVDDFNEVKTRVKEQYGGADNAGEIGVTSGGKLEIKELGVNNKDMDYVKLHKIVQEAIALQYKVPLPLITNAAATFNNYSEAKLALYDDAVLPLADKIYGSLSAFLLPRYKLDPQQVQITYDIDEITALSMRRNEELKLRKELAIESDNEMRAMIGREPYQGGDQIYKPANLIPVGQDTITNDNPHVLRDSQTGA